MGGSSLICSSSSPPAPAPTRPPRPLLLAHAEKYLREVWPVVTRTLKEHGIGCELNLVEGSMTVKTTRKTWDPYVIIKARCVLATRLHGPLPVGRLPAGAAACPAAAAAGTPACMRLCRVATS